MPSRFVLFVEPFGIEDGGILVVFFIIVEGMYRNDHPYTFFYDDIFTRYLVIFTTDPSHEGNWAVHPQRF